MVSPEKRLFELLDFVLDGSCTDGQREEFAQLIENNPHLTAGLAEEVFIHSLLQWQSEEVANYLADSVPLSALGSELVASRAGEGGALDSSGGQTSATVQRDSRSAPGRGRRSRGFWIGIAAAALVASFLALWQTSNQFYGREDAVAEIIEQDQVEWVQGNSALNMRRLVLPGRIQTSAGSFTMRFRSGPTVKISGAASMMIESDMLIHLDRGQATAHVPQQAKGFAIKTPVVDVIDQGTEFGVAVRENGYTDVVVFDGKVDLEDSISDSGLAKRLNRGEAARVDRQGSLERIMHVGRDQRGAWWTADYPTLGVNLIQEVRDNIPPSDGSKYYCYQIAYHALDEDADAYVDHPHQWNGLTREGLPEFLRGADYVRTFNDYRYLNDFEMVIHLARPANLYIFFDDRVPTPAWLSDQFEDTGVDIGLDEGPWEGIADHKNAVGGGNSIDNVFSVWRRRCLDTKPVTLAPVGETSEARAMYGIATTPLEPVRLTQQQLLGSEAL